MSQPKKAPKSRRPTVRGRRIHDEAALVGELRCRVRVAARWPGLVKVYHRHACGRFARGERNRMLAWERDIRAAVEEAPFAPNPRRSGVRGTDAELDDLLADAALEVSR